MCFQKITHASVRWLRGPGEGREWHGWIVSSRIHPAAGPCARAQGSLGERLFGGRGAVQLSLPTGRWESKELRAACEAPRRTRPRFVLLGRFPVSRFFEGVGRITYWSSNNPAGWVFNEGRSSMWSWGLVGCLARVVSEWAARSLGTGCSARLCSLFGKVSGANM